MKQTMKLFGLAFMVFGLFATSCAKDGELGPIGPMGPQGETGLSGSDGANGVDGTNGEDGIDGVDGTNGENGADGADGNANVMASNWIVADFPNEYAFSAATVTISDANITEEVLSTYTILGYFSFSDSFTEIYAIPFTEPLFRSFTMQQKIAIGEYQITELGNPDTVGTIAPIDGFVRYILVAPSSLSGKQANSNLYSIISMQENGVDLSNYFEVMDYLGMDY